MSAFRVRAHPFARGAIQMRRAGAAGLRPGMEVVERAEAGDEGRQDTGNIRIADIGIVIPSVNAVVMNFRMERLRHLAGGTAEVHKKTPGRDVIESEPMLREPLGNLPNILGRRPEPLAELLRCQPAVEVGRVRVVLPTDELLQLLFSGLAAPQHHKNMFLRQAVWCSAAVKLRSRASAHLAMKPSQAILIHLKRGRTVALCG
jgi:hypothetical protein